MAIPPPSGPEPLTRGHEFHYMCSNGLVGKCSKHVICVGIERIFSNIKCIMVTINPAPSFNHKALP